MLRTAAFKPAFSLPAGLANCARRWRADQQLRARVNASTELNGSVIIFPAFFCFLLGTLVFYDLDPDTTSARKQSLSIGPVRAADPTPREGNVREEVVEEGAHIDRTTGYLVPPTSLIPPLTDNDRSL